jgi:hypothetical protein
MTGRDEAMTHEQARMLAAESIDGPLAPEEADWLQAHLASCDDCRAVSDEYVAIHAELSTLAMPEPPRELWIRTQAALDRQDSTGARAFGRRSPRPRSCGRRFPAAASRRWPTQPLRGERGTARSSSR